MSSADSQTSSQSTFDLGAFQNLSLHTGDVGCGCPSCSQDRDLGPDTGTSPLDANIDGTGGTVAGKPVWTLDQVIAHLNRTGISWTPGPNNAVPNSGSAAVISYGFFDTQAQVANNGYVYQSGTQFFGFSEYFNFSAFTQAQRLAARESIAAWDDLIAVTFVETSANDADINFGNLLNAPTTQAYARLPAATLTGNPAINAQIREIAGDIWISTAQASNFQLDEGLYGIHTLTHEVGHALGLSHPGAYNAAPGLSITYAANAEYAQDTRAYTVMSYFNASALGARHFDFNISTTVYAATPMIHDIAVIQAIYGADPTTRTGDTTYGFNSNAGRDSFDFTRTPAPVMAIYDAGGIDTLDASGYDTQQLIDLRPGSLSSIGGVTAASAPSFAQTNANRAAAGLPPISLATYTANIAALVANPVVGRLTDNVGIAYGTIIENAVGGSGSDSIIGNAVANVLSGNAGEDFLFGNDGDDTLNGGSDNDYLDGGVGNDLMAGGSGDDIYIVDSVGDQVSEDADNGVDEIRTALASFTLMAHLENLTGTSSTGQTLIGNDADNAITGGAGDDVLEGGLGDDTLDGGAGADTLTGGHGDDVYVVDNAGDRIVEGGGAGTDEVRTTLATYTLANHLENLTGLASTGQTLTGNNADNIITGGAGGDTLTGGNGDDILLGGDGDDFLYGNNGNDFLLGGAGADRLEGGNGDDRLVGGSGDDILEGGNGSDVLVGGAGNDVLTGGNGADVFIIGPSSGNDRITDFGNGDLIDWSAMTDAGFQATITQSGRDTVISFSDGSSVTLVGAGSPRGDWYEDGPLSSLAAELVTLGDDAARQSDWILAA